MKVVRAFSISAVLVGMILLVSCSKPNEKLFYGTFTNDKISPQKTVRVPGSFKDFDLLGDSNAIQEGTEKIVKEWTDSEGNTWFQTYVTITMGPYKNSAPKVQTLSKVNKAGGVLEFVWRGVSEFDPKNFPTKIDPKAVAFYRMYNRVGD